MPSSFALFDSSSKQQRGMKKRQVIQSVLSIILHDKGLSNMPQRYMDKIYMTVLIQHLPAGSNDVERNGAYAILRYVLGNIAVLFSWLPTNSITALLKLDHQDDQKMLKDLCTILLLLDNSNCLLYPCYSSLGGFLFDNKRCPNPDLYMDEREAHRKMLINCIRLMSTSLKKNICSIYSPGMLIQDMEPCLIGKHITPELEYTCLYWGKHLHMSGIHIYVNDFIHQFLKEHLLHWLEVLSLIRRGSEGIRIIYLLFSQVLPSNCPQFYEFLEDAKRFALYNQPFLQQAPLQLYLSALVFAPGRGVIRKLFQREVLDWLKELPKIHIRRSGSLHEAQGHSSWVNAVAFSPDDKILASSSVDTTICLWDTTTAQCVQILKGHHACVNAITFRSDCKILASGSVDETIRFWDVATGQCLQTLEGHRSWVNAVAFSPNSRILASGSSDASIHLWDSTTGACVRILKGHNSWIRVVAFKPDSMILASGSGDKSIRLWDAKTGRCLHILNGHSSWVSMIKFRPDGRMLASGSGDRTVRLWDTGTGQCLQILDERSTDSLRSNSNLFKGDFQSSYGLFFTESWVTLNSQKLLWIPPEYRAPACLSIQSNMISLGYHSGEIILIVFKVDE